MTDAVVQAIGLCTNLTELDLSGPMVSAVRVSIRRDLAIHFCFLAGLFGDWG